MRVRYYGNVGSTSGYGRAAADLCMSLLATKRVDLEISPIGYNPTQARVALAGNRSVLVEHCKGPEALTEPDVVILHTLPCDVARAREQIVMLDSDLELVPFVAYTTWEGQTAQPSVLAGYSGFEQLWMPSSPPLRVFSAADPDYTLLPKVRAVVPHAFDVETLEERRVSTLGNTTTTHFYYIGAWNSRKNPSGLLRAWAMAFSPDDNVCLTLHSPGTTSDQFGVALHQTGLTPADMAPVVLSNRSIGERDILQMHTANDCFVTASRGEAWNLPAFDALLAGRMVIAPRYHGSDDYLENSSAIRYSGMQMPASVDVEVMHSNAVGMNMRTVGAQGLTSRDRWIEPDLAELAITMKVVAHEQARNSNPHYDIHRYGYDAVGKMALAYLKELV